MGACRFLVPRAGLGGAEVPAAGVGVSCHRIQLRCVKTPRRTSLSASVPEPLLTLRPGVVFSLKTGDDDPDSPRLVFFPFLRSRVT